jgi:hypothetical protein
VECANAFCGPLHLETTGLIIGTPLFLFSAHGGCHRDAGSTASLVCLLSLCECNPLRTLGFRGLCLWHARKLPEAQLAFSLAHKFDPMNPRIPQYVTTILNQEWDEGLKDGFNNQNVKPFSPGI